MKYYISALVLLIAAGIVTACSAEPALPTPVSAISTRTTVPPTLVLATAYRQSVSTATPAAAASHPTGTRTGVSEVDEVLTVVETGDWLQLAAQLSYFPWPCTHATGIGALPCLDTEQEGAPVQAILVTGCEGSFWRRGTVEDSVAHFLQFNDGKLYAVLKSPLFQGEAVPGDYLLLYANGQRIGVDAGGVTYLGFGCGEDAATWLRGNRQARITFDYLLPPP